MTAKDTATATLIAREMYLFEKYRKRWEPRTRQRLAFWWERGFIHLAAGSLAAWLAHGPAIVAKHPLRRVELVNRQPVFDGDDGWVWARAYDPELPDNAPGNGRYQTLDAGPHYLPPAVFDAVPAVETFNLVERLKGFREPAGAITGLSDGAIAWAKGGPLPTV